ncbi:MAG: divergent PAP2 family protein [Butyrivibrio sp.]|uniref:divergent PAP2 family protein n=1 Tax=Butyrivibrio sp. TaxID=28121 RepID=UPI0025B83D43|nr:divergent PAP2 family protein [Butyrivibrio sp.]MBQ6589118.1 divergent PAP2 family protein [Butyrivibrio sp.]
MRFFNDLFSNRILVAAFFGWLSAQVLKTIIYVLVNKEFNAERLTGDGGMPSSHSATVMALVTSTFYSFGAGSFEFAISGVLALIVMHDAMGVRRETGIQAKVINNMMDWFQELDSDIPVEEKLKEFVGHTPLQVLFGAILGVVVGIIICNF